MKFLESFADMAEQMTGGTKRCKQLTKDTARAISHTCKGMNELSHNLLSKTHEYVLLGKVSTNDFRTSHTSAHRSCFLRHLACF